MKKGLAALAVALVGLSFAPVSAGAVTSTTSCDGVVNGADNPNLTKSLVSTQHNTDGSITFTYKVVSTRAPGTDRLRDCVYVDTGAPGYDGETFISGIDNKDQVFVAEGDGSSTTFSETISGLENGDKVCDRAARSGGDDATTDTFTATPTDTSYTDKSNTLCVVVTGEDVPEAPFALLLPAAGLLALAGVFFLRRRSAAAA